MKPAPSPRARRLLASALALLGAAPLAGAQKLHLVDDIASKDLGASYHVPRIVELNGWRYFARDVQGVGAELYRTLGATGVVELVKDIAPGPDGSRPDLLTVHGGALYFAASDGAHGFELWRSDGTAAGTQMVLDIFPGEGSALEPLPWVRLGPVAAGGLLFFTASDGVNGAEIWTSDGTGAGTQRVSSLPGAGPSGPLVALGGEVFFSASSSLYKASAAGVTALKSFYGSPSGMAAMGGAVYFDAALNTATGYELWRSDGTPAGTLMVKDIYPGGSLAQSSYPSLLTALGPQLFFTANDGVHGRELWASDGSAAGTQLVRDIRPGAAGAVGDSVYWRLASFGGKAWFAADDGSGATLWRSDGTSAGTAPVLAGPAAPELPLLGALPDADVPGAWLFFAGSDGSGAELWRTDGTGPGTSLVADLAPGPSSSTPRGFAADGAGGAFFLTHSAAGVELRHSDGTAPGTLLIADQAVSTLPVTPDSDPRGVHDLLGRVLFAADDGHAGNEVWAVSDPEGEAQLLGDLNPGPAPAIQDGDPEGSFATPLQAVRLGASLCFLAHTGDDIALWRSDGTVPGTLKVRDFDLPLAGGYELHAAALGDTLVFSAFAAGSGWGIWRTDGTPAGTALLAQVTKQPMGFRRVGNAALCFVHGVPERVWRTDGTAGGTSIVHTLELFEEVDGTSSAVLGGELYFAASDPLAGMELWKSDGTPGGTARVADIQPGIAGSDPEQLTRVGDALYFTASGGAAGRELWRSDGTAAGTALIADLAAPGMPGPLGLTAVGERLFFGAAPSAATFALYAYAHPVLQLLHTFPQSNPAQPPVQWMRAAGSRRAFFQGNDGLFGQELWSSDGTPAGTQLFEDFLVDGWAGPSENALAGGVLYVAADDHIKGRELRYASIGATAQAIGAGCAASGLLPELAADDPVLGGASRVHLDGAQPSSAGMVFAGGAGSFASLGSGCELYLSPLAPLAIASALTDVAGSWDSPPFAIPVSSTLSGLQLSLQAVVGPTATPPLGFDVSNGVLLTFGP